MAGGAVIAVIGAGDADAALTALAERVGAGLAARGATVVCGGLGGVMAAACRGAKAGGGVTVGILPGTDRAAANPHVDVALATGLGEARNVLVVRSADAVVAIGGGYGTLAEIGFALKIGAPVVGLRTWELVRDGRRDPGIRVVADTAEAVELVLALARARSAADRRG